MQLCGAGLVGAEVAGIVGEPAAHDVGLGHQADQVTVGAIMTSPATAMTSGSDVVELVATMETAGIRSMPIVDGTRLVGIVTRRDLVRTVARPDASVATDVRHQLEIYGGQGRWTVDVEAQGVR